MTRKKRTAAESIAPTEMDFDPRTGKGRLKVLGGSGADQWNNVIANQTVQALWQNHGDEEERHKRYQAALAGLMGIAPRDELEGMMAAQIIAAHSAAMECYRRAMIPEQSFEGRRESLNQANRLSRTSTTLLDALNKHRGKGQQKVTVEHVHVHSGGQAIVGTVERTGDGDNGESREQAHAKEIVHTRVPLRFRDEERDAVPIRDARSD